VSSSLPLLCRQQPMAAGLGGYGSQALAGMASQQQLLGVLQQQQQQQQAMYDPMGGMDVSKLNALFMQRQQPALAGGFMRPVG
jgi:hypothetical protein